MFLGTVNDWSPEGTVVSWYPTEPRAPRPAVGLDDVPASYQQSRHLEFYREQTARAATSLGCASASGRYRGLRHRRHDAAINAHVRRHDTYHTGSRSPTPATSFAIRPTTRTTSNFAPSTAA